MIIKSGHATRGQSSSRSIFLKSQYVINERILFCFYNKSYNKNLRETINNCFVFAKKTQQICIVYISTII